MILTQDNCLLWTNQVSECPARVKTQLQLPQTTLLSQAKLYVFGRKMWRILTITLILNLLFQTYVELELISRWFDSIITPSILRFKHLFILFASSTIGKEICLNKSLRWHSDPMYLWSSASAVLQAASVFSGVSPFQTSEKRWWD